MPLELHKNAVCLAPWPLVHRSAGNASKSTPWRTSCSTVTKLSERAAVPLVTTRGSPRRKMRLLGIPTASAASIAVFKSEAHVNSAWHLTLSS